MHTVRRLLYVCCASLLVLSAAPLRAGAADPPQPASPEDEPLEAVVVTGSRITSAGFTQPTPTTVLSSADIEKVAEPNLFDAIAQLPALQGSTGRTTFSNSTSSGMQGLSSFSLRNLGTIRTLTLLDGQRVTPANVTGVVDVSQFPQLLMKRVDVVTGGASASYGSDAIGGVVNAIPAALPDATAGAFTRTTAELSGASNNREGDLFLGAEGARGRLGWRAAGIARLSEDMTTPDGKLENTKFAAVTGEAAAGFRSSRGTSTFRYARYGGEFHLLEANEPARPAGGEEEGGPERKLSDDRLQFTGNYAVGALRLEPKLQWQRHSLAEVSDELGPGGTPTGTETEVFNLLLNTVTADVLAHHGGEGALHGTLGVSGGYQTSDSRGIIPLVPDARVTTAAAFAFEQYDRGRVSLVAGARGDIHSLDADANADLDLSAQSRDASAFSGDVGAVVQLVPDLALAANVGRAWRSPTLFELFANGPRLGEARYEIGDPTLDPETSLNLDGSLRWSHRRAHAEVSGFSNRIEDFIYIAPTGQQQGNLSVYRYEHALATLKGAEVSADVDPTSSVTLRAKYDMVRGTNEDTDSPLPLMPPPRTTLETDFHAVGLGWAERAHAGIDVEISSKQTRLGQFDEPTDGYTLIGLDAGLARHIGSHPFRVDLRVRNLANTRYTSFLSRYKSFALDPGRNILFRISADF